MSILLVFWLLFLLGYVIFNVYGVSRVFAMRIKGDATGKIVLVYLIAVSLLIFASIAILSSLNWSLNFPNLLKR